MLAYKAKEGNESGKEERKRGNRRIEKSREREKGERGRQEKGRREGQVRKGEKSKHALLKLQGERLTFSRVPRKRRRLQRHRTKTEWGDSSAGSN